MPRRPRIQFPDALYHVTSRGNARRDIFHTDDDRERFLNQLEERSESYDVIIHAYVLMNNHYHLLVRTPRANLARFMQRLNTSYALYYRYKHGKPGHVFQGRYKALLVTDDSYVLSLTRYIHLNPIKTKKWSGADPSEVRRYLRSYRWSSFPQYIKGKATVSRLDLSILNHYGRSLPAATRRYRAYTEAMITRDDEDLLSELRSTADQLGDETPASAGDRGRAEYVPTLMEIAGAVARYFDTDIDLLQRHGHTAGSAKRIAMELATRTTGLSLKAIGEHFGGVSASAVTMNRSRMTSIEQEQLEMVMRALNSV